ncbi:MAG: phosphonate ABC transporter ATP-binding protein [Deltaproteobacteria bacterium]|jgi:phosphonate transport system ATP-binding protein|nr:phosphonate ABC transporter ATP-binding protein [Deltaproteobacteria bacterium]
MIQIQNLNKTFAGAPALQGLSFSVGKGEMVALIGASGSGKSTLIRHMSGLVQGDPESGSIVLGGDVIQEKGVVSKRIRDIRAGIGVVFQGFNLVGRLSVETNVMLGALGRAPLWRSLLACFGQEERSLAFSAMEKVGILETAGRRASTLSGGQRQRVAIARALVQRAKVILADEPIASLDPETSRKIMEILRDLNREDGFTVVVSLHQVDYARKYCPRAIALKSGMKVYDGPSQDLTPELMREIYGGRLEDFQSDEDKDAGLGALRPLEAYPEFARESLYSAAGY